LHRLVCGSPIEALGDDKKPGSPIEALGDDKKRKGSRSQGFEGSSGSLDIFFKNQKRQGVREAKDSPRSAVSLASPPPPTQRFTASSQS
jgi:hypothetical protein